MKKSRTEQDGIFLKKINQIVGFKPDNLEIYQRAFTHSSVNKMDSNGNIISYERLEFLGDAILGSVIATYLYKEVPNQNEGYLTKMRAKIVSRENLNNLGKQLGLIGLIESKISKNNIGDNIHGNLFEALIGAIYLDKGYTACERFINTKLVQPYVDIERLEGKVISYKSLLIEWCQKHKKNFKILVQEEESADVQKYFAARLFIDDKQIAKARATSKKKSEEIASKRAYFVFQEDISRRK